LVDRVARSPVSFLPASIYINSAFPSDSCNQNAGYYMWYCCSAAAQRPQAAYTRIMSL